MARSGDLDSGPISDPHRDTRHPLLIDAYRDNEVRPEHPLALALDIVRLTDTGRAEVRLREGALTTEHPLVQEM
jgi:hypothetical protein